MVLPPQLLLVIDVLLRCLLAGFLSLLAFPYMSFFLVLLLIFMAVLRNRSIILSNEAMKL